MTPPLEVRAHPVLLNPHDDQFVTSEERRIIPLSSVNLATTDNVATLAMSVTTLENRVRFLIERIPVLAILRALRKASVLTPGKASGTEVFYARPDQVFEGLSPGATCTLDLLLGTFTFPEEVKLHMPCGAYLTIATTDRVKDPANNLLLLTFVTETTWGHGTLIVKMHASAMLVVLTQLGCLTRPRKYHDGMVVVEPLIDEQGHLRPRLVH